MMVEGRIDFVPERPDQDTADVHIWVEDTTYADEAAVRLFGQSMAGMSMVGASEGLPFRLDYSPPERTNRTCTLAVLVDLDADGAAGHGDYISTRAVSVPTGGALVRVRVQRID